jgi:hypothetical protein
VVVRVAGERARGGREVSAAGDDASRASVASERARSARDTLVRLLERIFSNLLFLPRGRLLSRVLEML